MGDANEADVVAAAVATQVDMIGADCGRGSIRRQPGTAFAARLN
jgi:hypothetical protein